MRVSEYGTTLTSVISIPAIAVAKFVTHHKRGVIISVDFQFFIGKHDNDAARRWPIYYFGTSSFTLTHCTNRKHLCFVREAHDC